MISYTTSRRTAEIGIRMAVGLGLAVAALRLLWSVLAGLDTGHADCRAAAEVGREVSSVPIFTLGGCGGARGSAIPVGVEETFGLKDYSDDSPTYSVDPVCGAKVDEAKAAGHTGYAGETYYFCSLDCQRNFEDNPGYYIGQSR